MREINDHNAEGTDRDGHGRKLGKPKTTAGGFSESETMKGNKRLGAEHPIESPKGERQKPVSGKMHHKY